MADIKRTLGVSVNVTKEGQLEVLRDLSKDAGDLDKLADGAEKSVNRLFGQIERNGSASEKTLTQAKLAVDDYAKALDDAAAAGETIGDAQKEKLADLQTAYDEAIQKTGDFRTAQDEVKGAVAEATEKIADQAKGLDEAAKATDKYAESAKGAGKAAADIGKDSAQGAGEAKANIGQLTTSMKQLGSETADTEVKIAAAAGVARTLGGAVGAAAVPIAAIAGLMKAAEAVTTPLANGISKLIEHFTGLAGAVKGFGAGIIPERSFQRLVELIFETGSATDDLTGKLEKQKQKYEEVQAKYLAAIRAHQDQGAAAHTAAAGEESLAAATAKSGEAAKTAAAASQALVDLEMAHADAVKRTTDELAAASAARQKALDAETAALARHNAELQKAIESADAAIEAAKRYNETLGQTEEAANRATAAIDAMVASATSTDVFGNKTEFGYGVPDSHNIKPNW